MGGAKQSCLSSGTFTLGNAIEVIGMRKDTRAGRLYEELRHAIVDGRLLPGDPLLETELSETYGVSRTPVREAIRRLHHAGLVEMIPFSSARVARVSREDVIAAFDLRLWLEPPVFAHAAGLRSPEMLQALETILTRMPERPSTRAEALKSVEADFAYHMAVFESVGNPYAIEILENVLSITRRAVNFSPPPRYVQARREHIAIMAALASADEEAAALSVRQHITNARNRYSGGYFD